jgi:pyruvate dehydrogenase E1 component alpha subunit
LRCSAPGRWALTASTLGKEAIDAGVGAVLARDDVVLPSYRESGILLLRGVSRHRVFLYWGGDERGNVFPESPRDFPFCVPIALQVPHAVGVAYAIKLRKEPRVALVVNNQYAISVPRSRQSAAETLAQKGIAAGIACEQLDGNDPIAVRDVWGARSSARAGARA